MEQTTALTVTEAAKTLRISRANLYRLFRSEELRYAKVGGRTLIRRKDIDALLERSLVSAQETKSGA